MSESNQLADPISRNEGEIPVSLTVTSEKPPSIVSGNVGHDIERQKGIIERQERGSPDEPPDGGLQAWTVVLGAWCCSFCCYGWINSIGIFQAYYETHQLRSYSSSTISWIPSLEIFFMLFMGPVIGKLYDSFGPRYILLFGSLAHVFGLMMASISDKYYQFLLTQGVVSAIGASAVFTPSLSAVATWFHQKRGLAFGITMSGSSTGGVIFPIMINKLIPRVGFGWSMRIAAFMILGLLVIANLTVKSRTPPHPQPAITLTEFFSPLTERTYLLTALGNFLFIFGLFIPINYIVVQAVAEGMSQDLAGYLVPILNAASLFGRIIPGFLSDKFGRYNGFALVTILTSILILALWIPASSNSALMIFAGLFGFASGAFISLGPALVAQISPIHKIGVRQGLLFGVMSIGGLTTGPIGGAILSHENGSFTGVKIFAGVMCFAGSLFASAARISAVGLSPTIKF
ncbi:MFS general substrate transporter [Plenodomus tracheiphilus IPT5]|uniref:MFS general substrate transporter n=1 Tax=Plenodomus tracheiphilus IPT5 TaxID=1408161 RepID=A0A6A7AMS0_9PLEO|nr:MFS general substrate transporter [Plenodomus tracheiphilus IPT5]